jgi:hypothetical protein
MHPTTTLYLANERIAELYRQAERERLVRTALASRRQGRSIGRLIDELTRRETRPSELPC